MPRTCIIDPHPDRDRIETEVADGVPLRDIGSRANPPVSKDAISRHMAKCVNPATIAKAREAKEAGHAASILDRVEGLAKDARRLQETAEAAGDTRTAIAALREATRIVTLAAQLAGELGQAGGSTTNVQVNAWIASPDFAAFAADLRAALGPFPEALARAVRVLERRASEGTT